METARSQVELHARTRARARIAVDSSETKPYGQSASPALMEVRLTERLTGDIDGESPVRALQIVRDDRSASLVSVQRFRGKVGGRQGTFMLQGEEIVEHGKITEKWSVVPGSGTDHLSGLRGEGGFEGEFGKGWKERWIIGSNSYRPCRELVGTVCTSGVRERLAIHVGRPGCFSGRWRARIT